jgi:hypothetical protein
MDPLDKLTKGTSNYAYDSPSTLPAGVDTDEERFYQLLNEMKKIHDAKRHDYASEEDRFSNLMLSEMMGIPAWKGALVRISDKFSRLCEFAQKEEFEVKDESIKDTLIDMANYALICLILYERGE